MSEHERPVTPAEEEFVAGRICPLCNGPLEPPLSSEPPPRRWYCPDCEALFRRRDLNRAALARGYGKAVGCLGVIAMWAVFIWFLRQVGC